MLRIRNILLRGLLLVWQTIYCHWQDDDGHDMHYADTEAQRAYRRPWLWSQIDRADGDTEQRKKNTNCRPLKLTNEFTKATLIESQVILLIKLRSCNLRMKYIILNWTYRIRNSRKDILWRIQFYRKNK